MGLIKEQNRFLFDRRLNVRQAQDCPVYAGMIEHYLDQVHRNRSAKTGRARTG